MGWEGIEKCRRHAEIVTSTGRRCRRRSSKGTGKGDTKNTRQEEKRGDRWRWDSEEKQEVMTGTNAGLSDSGVYILVGRVGLTRNNTYCHTLVRSAHSFTGGKFRVQDTLKKVGSFKRVSVGDLGRAHSHCRGCARRRDEKWCEARSSVRVGMCTCTLVYAICITSHAPRRDTTQ